MIEKKYKVLWHKITVVLDDYQLIHMKLIINKAINLLEFQPNLIQINL